MDHKIKVLFFTYNLGGGGAERVLVNLVNNMDKTKFDITVQTMFSAGVNKAYLNSDIRLIETKAPCFKGCSRLIKIIPSSWLYKFFIKETYDVLIAFMHGAPTKVISGNKSKDIARIAWLHTDMRNSSLPKFFTHSGVVKSFKTYTKIVGVSESVSNSFVEVYGLSDLVVTKYNVNDVKKISLLSKDLIENDGFKNNVIKVVSVGRLAEEKGYKRLIECCKKLSLDKIEFELVIVGTGPQEALLNKMIADYNLEDKVRLIGFKSNPYPYIKAADFFVCSSHQEGLSTVISEAIILGVPVISTDVSGAKEVLGANNEYGLVVENDNETLYDGIKKLLTNPEMLSHYRKKAEERAGFFDTRTTVGAVEELIEEVAK